MALKDARKAGWAMLEQMGRTTEFSGMERKRVEAVVETLANSRGAGESVAEVAHDARNMVTALGLYCDLLEVPGVLATPFSHYGSELRLVAAASRRLVEKLVALDNVQAPQGEFPPSAARGSGLHTGNRPANSRANRWDSLPAVPIENLADELRGLRSLVTSLAGPAVTLTLETEGGGEPVHLTAEDLTRILVNLVKNSSEAMPAGGKIALGLHEFHSGTSCPAWMVVTLEDSGPGIGEELLDRVFEPGYSTRKAAGGESSTWPSTHQGLGLSICRSIVERAGGKIYATSLADGGARFVIELPVRRR